MRSKAIEDFIYAAVPGQDDNGVKLVERECLRDFLRVSPARGNYAEASSVSAA